MELKNIVDGIIEYSGWNYRRK